MTGTYDPALVVFSLLVAVLASYTALEMAGRLAIARGGAAYAWMAGGALALGLGIWSMHFIAMLAFHLPIPVGYDLAITLYSLAVSVGASAYALWLVSHRRVPARRLLAGATLMGAGIAAMHYLGMAALRMQPGIDYDPAWFATSILVAIGASGAALWIALRLRREARNTRILRAAASLVMGLAIVGMHYTGMAAARFAPGSICGAALGGELENRWLAVLVIVTTLGILGITLIAALFDRRMHSQTGRLADSLARANRELEHAALHDPLTQLPNRILLRDRIEQAIEEARRCDGRVAVIFCDLDGFKLVNDAYGHPFGDRLLVLVAERVRALLRPQDTLSRLGGDEFVVVLGVATAEDAVLVADRITAALAEPFVMDAAELQLSGSLGIALYPDDAGGERDLMARADAAMYHTKHTGRNGYTFFAPAMQASASRRLRMLQDLRRALARGELVLHYQPKFPAGGGPVTGAEALLRWQHPELGLLGPDAFIPIAERSGLILPIGDWVLDQACAQLRAWHQAGHREWTMAVNLSALQFTSPALVGTVREVLQRHGLEARHLTLEVTESTAMKDVEASVQLLRTLSAMGVKIAIDDFGTGYSSLLYLKRMPASELKIDRAFVRELRHGTEDAAIVASIVALGRSLQLQIVAEGVETEAQRSLLGEMGCDVLQGYHLGVPMPPAEFLHQAGIDPTRFAAPATAAPPRGQAPRAARPMEDGTAP